MVKIRSSCRYYTASCHMPHALIFSCFIHSIHISFIHSLLLTIVLMTINQSIYYMQSTAMPENRTIRGDKSTCTFWAKSKIWTVGCPLRSQKPTVRVSGTTSASAIMIRDALLTATRQPERWTGQDSDGGVNWAAQSLRRGSREG